MADDFDLVLIAHELSFGANWINTTDVTEFYRFTNGENTFNGTLIGLPLADFMLGRNSNFSQQPAVADQSAAELRRRLRAGRVARWPDVHVELRPTVGAVPADEQSRRSCLSLRPGALRRRHQEPRLPECAGGPLLSGRRGLSRTIRDVAEVGAVRASRGSDLAA